MILGGREIKVRGALRRFANTPDGLFFFRCLQEDIIKIDTFDKDPRVGAYNEGKRDALRDLLISAKADIKDLNITYNEGETLNG